MFDSLISRVDGNAEFVNVSLFLFIYLFFFFTISSLFPCLEKLMERAE